MKALELAEITEERPTMVNGRKCAAELRRLAEVNAELLGALELTLTLAVLKFGNLDNDVNTIFEQARAAIAKAKEQQ